MLLLGSAAQGYGNIDDHESSAAVVSACARCSSQLGHALGDPWTSCVVEELLKEQAEAKQAGRPYFPMVPHVYQPLAPKHGAYPQAELFKHLLRNCTCDFDDGGSRPLRSLTWEYRPFDPCAGGAPPPFAHSAGFLPAVSPNPNPNPNPKPNPNPNPKPKPKPRVGCVLGGEGVARQPPARRASAHPPRAPPPPPPPPPPPASRASGASTGKTTFLEWGAARWWTRGGGLGVGMRYRVCVGGRGAAYGMGGRSTRGLS